jgi:hypothetical protein
MSEAMKGGQPGETLILNFDFCSAVMRDAACGMRPQCGRLSARSAHRAHQLAAACGLRLLPFRLKGDILLVTRDIKV